MALTNRTLFTGDNLYVLRGMNSDSVDLIYLDPPFNSNATYSAPIGSEAAGAAFKDTWTLDDVDAEWQGQIADEHPGLYKVIDAAGASHSKGMQAYLIMMAIRLIEMQRVLRPAGSIYLHCDPTASHYLKALMDAVFGRECYRNEITWKRTSSHNSAKRWGPVHDTLLFYAADGYTWNREVQPLDRDYVDKFYRFSDDKGRYRLGDLTGSGTRSGDSGMPWRGVDPSSKSRHWAIPADRALPDWFDRPVGYADMTSRQRLDVLDSQGLVYWPPRGSVPSFKRYLLESSGAPITDFIADITPLGSAAKERCGYPTQKPLALLERIIKASSNEGDIVLDPFCGCATTLVAAEKLSRNWCGADLSDLAVKLVKQRIRRELGALLFKVHHRTDIPKRTDQGKLPPPRSHAHRLYGEQEGVCSGCQTHFPFRVMQVDHRIPQAKGGGDDYDNLQMLCSGCNLRKGTGTMVELLAKLRRDGILA